MGEYIFPIESSLFYWVVIAYFILLYHSFDIEKIQVKMRGVEVLFISVALGISLSFIFNLLNPLFDFISYWYTELKFVRSIPFTFNAFQRHSHEPLTTQMEYYAFFVFIILFAYMFTVLSIAIIIKIIQKLLDPKNDIYPGIKRFSIFNDNKIPEFVIWGIPRLISTIGFLILFLGLTVGYALNISEITLSVEGFFQILLALTFTIFEIGVVIMLLNVVYYDFKLISPLFTKFYYQIRKNIHDRNLKNKQEDIRKSKLNTFFFKYPHITIYLSLMFVISFVITDFYNNQMTFLEMILITIISILMMVVLFFFKPKL